VLDFALAGRAVALADLPMIRSEPAIGSLVRLSDTSIMLDRGIHLAVPDAPLRDPRRTALGDCLRGRVPHLSGPAAQPVGGRSDRLMLFFGTGVDVKRADVFLGKQFNQFDRADCQTFSGRVTMTKAYSYACRDCEGMEFCPANVTAETKDEVWQLMDQPPESSVA